MQDDKSTDPTGAERFEHMLREQIRTANEHSTSGPPGFAARDEFSADELLVAADSFRSRLTAEQLESLDRMSDDTMRALATGSRWLAWVRRSNA